MKRNLPLSVFTPMYSCKSVLISIGLAAGLSITAAKAQDTQLYLTGSFSAAQSTYTYLDGSSNALATINYLTASQTTAGDLSTLSFVPASVSTSTSAICGAATHRVQVNSFDLVLTNLTASKIVMAVTSSGSADRTLLALYKNGTLLTSGTDFTIDGYQTGGASACGNITISGLSGIAKGTTLRFVFGSAPTSTPQNARLSVITVTPDASLPIHLSNFQVFNRSNGIQLVWNAATEVNIRSYTIERSNNGQSFTPIHTQLAGSSNYQYTDASISTGGSGMVFYRIKSTDLDGTISYSTITAISLGRTSKLSLSPNPVITENLFVNFGALGEPGTLNIINTFGVILNKIQLKAGSQQVTIPTGGLKSGTYLVQLVQGTQVQTSKFVKQ